MIHSRQGIDHSKWAIKNPFVSTESSEEERNGWRPFTLRAPYLSCMTLFLVTLIAVLEYLSYRSARDGGVTFAGEQGHYSLLQTFSFLYLPTIIAVSLSLAWSWVDLDAKRLEPYFQLSKSTGAFAERSVLLQYPNEYLPLIPLKALRSRYVCYTSPFSDAKI